MKTKLNAALLSLVMALGLVFIADQTIHAQDIYSVGYSYGQQDRRAGRKNDFKRYNNQYNRYQKQDFKKGYEDGYRDAVNGNWGRYGNGNNRNDDYRNGGYRNDDYRNGGYGNNNYGNGYATAPPNWMVGSFRGFTPGNNTYTQIDVYRDGSISIVAENGTGASRGYYRDGTVYFQWGQYRFRREGNGFRAVNQDNSNDRVVYQRIR